jgi:hypothetical protein
MFKYNIFCMICLFIFSLICNSVICYCYYNIINNNFLTNDIFYYYFVYSNVICVLQIFLHIFLQIFNVTLVLKTSIVSINLINVITNICMIVYYTQSNIIQYINTYVYYSFLFGNTFISILNSTYIFYKHRHQYNKKKRQYTICTIGCTDYIPYIDT